MCCDGADIAWRKGLRGRGGGVLGGKTRRGITEGRKETLQTEKADYQEPDSQKQLRRGRLIVVVWAFCVTPSGRKTLVSRRRRAQQKKLISMDAVKKEKRLQSA